MRSMVRFETRRAFGCGQNTGTFPPAIIEMPLLMMVSLGFVTGVITAMTPYEVVVTRAAYTVMSSTVLPTKPPPTT